MIFDGSRYERSPIRMFEGTDGQVRRGIVTPLFYGTRFAATKYVTKEGDRLDMLAYEAYQDHTLWWAIAVANPEVLYPDEIPPGTVIRIPSVPSLR